MTEDVFSNIIQFFDVGILGLLMLWIWRIQVVVEDKVSGCYKRMDKVREELELDLKQSRSEFVKQDIFEIEKNHLQENHNNLSRQVGEIASDVKIILREVDRLLSEKKHNEGRD